MNFLNTLTDMRNYEPELKMLKELALDILERDTLNYEQKIVLMDALVRSQIILLQSLKENQNGNLQ